MVAMRARISSSGYIGSVAAPGRAFLRAEKVALQQLTAGHSKYQYAFQRERKILSSDVTSVASGLSARLRGSEWLPTPQLLQQDLNARDHKLTTFNTLTLQWESTWRHVCFVLETIHSSAMRVIHVIVRRRNSALSLYCAALSEFYLKIKQTDVHLIEDQIHHSICLATGRHPHPWIESVRTAVQKDKKFVLQSPSQVTDEAKFDITSHRAWILPY